MGTGPLTLSFSGPVARIEFHRPERRNALDQATWARLPALVGEAVARPETRVLAITGGGGNFAAGADIAEFDDVFATRQSTLDYMALMAAATSVLQDAPIPVVAGIEGLCIGAGVSIAMACDLRLASMDAQFAVTPAKLGLAYPLADMHRLAAEIGPSATRDLLFTGRMIDAAEALRMGLLNQVFEPTRFAEGFEAYLAQVAAVSGWSNRKSKAIVALAAQGVSDDTDETRSWFADAPQGPDFREGLAAFRARRTPLFP